jgi:hypothetical protein
MEQNVTYMKYHPWIPMDELSFIKACGWKFTIFCDEIKFIKKTDLRFYIIHEKSKALGGWAWCFSPRNALHKEKIGWMLNVFFLGSCIVGRMSNNHLMCSTTICVLCKKLSVQWPLSAFVLFCVLWKKHWTTTWHFLMCTRIIPCRENVKWPPIYILLGLCVIRKTLSDYVMSFSWDRSLWEECWAST